MLFTHKGTAPKVDSSVFLAPGACVIGDVSIGRDSSLWFNVVVRGDVNSIRIGSRTNIQDGSIVHVSKDTHPTVIGDNVTIAHSVTLHGCTVGDGCMVGIGATVLDGAVVGASSMIAAGSLVTPGTLIPPRSLVLGSPAQVKRPLSDDECRNIHSYSDRYVKYREDYRSDVERIG